MVKSSDMMPLVEKRLRNLSILVSNYQAHVTDLIRFACIAPNKNTSDEILKKTFILVFRSIKSSKRKESLPLHLFIYAKTIEAVKKAKQTPPKHALGVKDLKKDISIENFNPADIKEPDLFGALNRISPEDRMLLCLGIRHKINSDELATLFKSSRGTVISRSNDAKASLAKAIIEAADISPRKQLKDTDSKDCFFAKNNVAERSKIEKHISKCEACRNFYNWHVKIDKLFEEEPKPVISSSINREIFQHLNAVSIHRRLLYSIRTKWNARVAFVVALLLLLSGTALWIRSYKGPRKSPVQEIKISNIEAKKEVDIKYSLTTVALKDWKDMNKKIKETIKNYGDGSENANEQGVLYTIILDKNEAIKLVQEIQAQANFDVKTVTETQPLKSANDIRVEIQVNKNGI